MICNVDYIIEIHNQISSPHKNRGINEKKPEDPCSCTKREIVKSYVILKNFYRTTESSRRKVQSSLE